MSKTNAALAQVCSLPTRVLLPERVVRLFRGFGGRRIFGFEVIESVLAMTNVCKEVEIIIEEVYISSQSVIEQKQAGLHDLHN